jgi:hypothetical protein
MKTVSSAPSSSNIRIDSEHIRHTDLVRRAIRSLITLFYTYVVQHPEWRVSSTQSTGSCHYKTPKEKTLIGRRTEAHTRPERHLEPFGLGRTRICFFHRRPYFVAMYISQACCGFRRTHFGVRTNWWKKFGTTELCLKCIIRVQKCSKNLAANSDF